VAGVGSDPSAAVHFDGVYIPRPSLVLVESYDLGRIEVLKGPEGTLYGRNATAGVVNIITESPGDEFGIGGFVGAGTDNLFRTNIAVDIPMGDRGGIRISGAYSKDDGYTDIIDGATITPDLPFLAPRITPGSPDIDNIDYQSFRLKGEFELGDHWSTTFSLQTIADDGTVGRSQSHVDGSPGFATDLGGGAQRIDPRTISLDPVVSRDLDGLLASLTFEGEIGNMTFKSITGYVDFTDDLISDSDGTGIWIERVFITADSEFFSQEFQLSGDFGGSGFWTGGLYFSKEDMFGTGLLLDSFFAPGDTLFSRWTSDGESKSAAIFGEVTFELTSTVSATLGARYTSEEKTGDIEGENIDFTVFPFGTAPYSGSVEIDDDAFTPKFGLEYAPSDDQLWYVSATNGFKSGGYSADNPVTSYGPEEIWAYEVGTKSTFAGGLVTLTAAAFYFDYTDIQLSSAFFPPTGGAFIRITNAASAEVTGLELGLDANLNDNFSIDLGVAYLSTSIDGFIPPGETETVDIDMPLAPEWDGFFGVNFNSELGKGNLSARVEYTYRSEIVFGTVVQAVAREDAIGLVNANIRFDFADDRWYIAAIARNLLDETYLVNRFFFDTFADTETYAAPRRLELRIGTNF